MIYIYLFVYSSIIFSFIHVAAKSIPRKKPFLFRFSECDTCHQQLGIIEIIPIFSYCWNRGYATCCGSRIQSIYLIYEVLCPIVICLFFSRLGWEEFVLAAVIFAWLTFFSLTDYYYLHIPNVTVYLFLFFACLFRWLTEFKIGPILNDFVWSILFFGTLYFFFKRGIGLGDIKLLIILGTALGFLESYSIFCFAVIMATVIIGILFLLKKVNRSTYFPFVPFIYFSFICYMTFQ
ncbi:prepilin peptidase [Listeria ilorinensis]|uniref:prepilin peptidase n=1 Tax=Listeria ilorinensis TaxID=2867439 RepID=UPI00336C20E7